MEKSFKCPLKTSVAASCLPSKKTQGPFFCVCKASACKSCTTTRNITLNTVIIKKRGTFGGKGTDIRNEDRKTVWGLEKS